MKTSRPSVSDSDERDCELGSVSSPEDREENKIGLEESILSTNNRGNTGNIKESQPPYNPQRDSVPSRSPSAWHDYYEFIELGEIPEAFHGSDLLLNAVIRSRILALKLIKKDDQDSKHRNSRIRGIVRGIIGGKGIFHFYYQHLKVRGKSLKTKSQYQRALISFILKHFPLECIKDDLSSLFSKNWKDTLQLYNIFLSLNQAAITSGKKREVLNRFKVETFYQSIKKLSIFLDSPVARVIKIRDIFLDALHFALSEAQSDSLRNYLRKVLLRIESGQ